MWPHNYSNPINSSGHSSIVSIAKCCFTFEDMALVALIIIRPEYFFHVPFRFFINKTGSNGQKIYIKRPGAANFHGSLGEFKK